MALVRWLPGTAGNRGYLDEMEALRNQMSNLFDSFLSPARGGVISRAGVFPPLNISEDENSLFVQAELPGIPAGEIQLTVENDKLIIRGERKIPERDKKVNIHRQEREAGYFRRVVTLPVKVDADRVSAFSKNGVLEITLPKAREAKPRQITIQAA